MITNKKKLKLVSYLKKLGDTDYNELGIVENILDDVKTIKEKHEMFEKSSTALNTVLRRKLYDTRTALNEANSTIQKQIKSTSDNSEHHFSRLEGEIKKKADAFKPAIFTNNGFLLNKKYNNLNFIGDAGITIQARDNPTHERVDIFVASTVTSGIASVTHDTTLTGLGTAASPLHAVATTTTPGGSTTQIQFNDAGAFNGNSLLTFNKSTGSFTAGGFNVTGAALSYSSGALITVADVGGSITSIQQAGGNYTANGDTYEIQVYAYKLVNGQKIFSSVSSDGFFTDDFSSTSYYIQWGWPAVVGADGYRVFGQPDLTSANTPVFYIDTVATGLNQGLGESWIFQGTIPFKNVLPQSAFNDTMTFRGKLDNSIGYILTPNIISNSGDLTLQQNNDLFGSTLLTLGNRGGINGIMVQNLGIDLCDVLLNPQSGVQATMRWEHRLGSVDPTNDGWGEWQLFVAGSSAFPTSPISTTSSTQVIQAGFNSIWLNAPTTVEGRGGVAFQVKSSGFVDTTLYVTDLGVVLTKNNTLDNGSGGMTLASDLTLSTHNLVTDTTTGTIVATGSTQKLAFWGQSPTTQYLTIGTTTGFTAATGTAVLSGSTFTGGTGTKAYTIGDIVKALKVAGIMASS